MAIYTYRCVKCELERHIKHKDTEVPNIRCDKCQYSMIRVILQNNLKRVTK